MNGQKKHIETLLMQGKTVQIFPQGYSMYPLFIPGRDAAILQGIKPSELKRGDVALYRRDHGILVLHRVFRISREGFYMVGDNQSVVEGPLQPEQFYGRLVAFVRNGKKISVRHPVYRLAAGLWLILFPLRPFFFGLSRIVHKYFIHSERSIR